MKFQVKDNVKIFWKGEVKYGQIRNVSPEESSLLVNIGHDYIVRVDKDKQSYAVKESQGKAPAYIIGKAFPWLVHND